MRKIRGWTLWLMLGCAFPAARTMAQGHGTAGGMRMRLERVYLQDSLLWMRFGVRNRSAFDFRVGWMEFDVRRRHRLRRTALQEFRLQPRATIEPSMIPGDSTATLIYGLTPRVIGEDRELLVELRERNQDRMVPVVIGGSRLLRATRIKPGLSGLKD